MLCSANNPSVVICSIARLPYVVVLPTTADSTYTQAILGVWSIVEVNLGIACACAMRLKPLITTYLPQLGIFSSRSRSKSRATAGKKKKSYQLHSIQKGSGDRLAGSKGIHVSREYEVDVERTHGSADKILI